MADKVADKNKHTQRHKLRYKMASCVFIGIIICAAVGVAVACIIVVSTHSVTSSGFSDPDLIVVIDPGHGGEDGGAVGVNGLVEKGINLSISLKLKSFFTTAGYTVIMTREDDRAIYDEGCDTLREKKVSDIHNRFKIIEKYPDSVFISIHQNKYPQSKYSGTQVFYSDNNPLSKILAQTIQSTVKGMLQNNNDREIKVAQKNLYLLYNAPSPAVLVECGFLSNAEEAEKLKTDDYQNKIAFAIFYATLQYRQIKEETLVTSTSS